MTQDEEIEFDRLKTARDSLLLTVANLRGMLETIAADEREACAKVADTISGKYGWGHYGNEVDTADEIAAAIRARGQA
jgi:hypothetical protein